MIISEFFQQEIPACPVL